jgi:MFS family permease
MMMGPRLRKFALIVHVALSVGWIGAVAAYIALDVSTTMTVDAQQLRAAYLATNTITTWAIVPLAFGALVTGLIMSLGTKWGLFQHYWTLISLVLTVLATLVLIVETKTINHYASIAADPATTAEDLRGLGTTLLHSIGGTIVLLVILWLNMYKPRGLTRYGWRKQQTRARSDVP